jgi:hypothetical protein
MPKKVRTPQQNREMGRVTSRGLHEWAASAMKKQNMKISEPLNTFAITIAPQ